MKPTGQKHTVDIRPSRTLGWFLCSIHLIALTVVVYYSLRLPICLLLILPLYLSWIRSWSNQVLLSADEAVVSVEWGSNGAWALIERQGRRTEAQLMERSFAAPWLTLLSFSCQTGVRRYVILLSDNSDTDQVRRLRVRLRLNSS